MKFLADEGIDGRLVAALRLNGHDVTYAAESLCGESDSLILETANKENRILITRDKDFGELVFIKNRIHSGIIL